MCKGRPGPGQHDALSNREYEKPGGNAIIAPSEKPQGEQGGCNHQADAVDPPGSGLKISASDHGPKQTEYPTQCQTGHDHNVQLVLHKSPHIIQQARPSANLN